MAGWSTILKVPEKDTLYLMEVFDVTVSERTMRILEAAAKVDINKRWLFFVPRDHILGGNTQGVPIGKISRYIL